MKMNFDKQPLKTLKTIKGHLDSFIQGGKELSREKLDALVAQVSSFSNAPWKAALITLFTLTMGSSAMAASPNASSEKAPTTADRLKVPAATWEKLVETKDSLASQIDGYEQDLLVRVGKGHPHEVKKSHDDQGKPIVTKTYWMKAEEGGAGPKEVQVSYSVDTNGVEHPLKISLHVSKGLDSKESIEVTDGAYGTGITGSANHVRVVNSQGQEAHVMGFMKDGSQDSLGKTKDVYQIVGTVHPIGELQTLQAYVNTQTVYDGMLKQVLHVPNGEKHVTTPGLNPQHVPPVVPPQSGFTAQNGAGVSITGSVD